MRLETIANKLASPVEILPDKAVSAVGCLDGKGQDNSAESRVVSVSCHKFSGFGQDSGKRCCHSL